MIICKWLQIKHNINYSIHTSANMRASQPAAALAKLLGVDCTNDSRLNCLNYPEDDGDWKKILNNGGLPWNKEAVDTVCGNGEHAKICTNMKAIHEKSVEPQTVAIHVTHTQQLNASCEYLNKVAMRSEFFSYIAVDTLGNVTFQTAGLYSSEKFTVDSLQGNIPGPLKPK